MVHCRPMYCICGCKLPQRIAMSIFCLLGIIVGYGQRASLNIAITRIVAVKVGNMSRECQAANVTSAREKIRGGTFDWTEKMQGFILSAFFIGYFIGHIPSGICADKIGGRITYSMGILISSVMSLVTPLIITYTEWYIVIIGRALAGLGQSAVFPATSALVAYWVPFKERTTLGAFSFSSNALGTVFGNLVSGVIMSYTLNWPNIFYFWGSLGMVWLVFFLMFVYDNPQKHPHITEEEKLFLESQMEHHTKLKVPWKRILSDKGIWAMILGQTGHDFTLFLVITNSPKYMNDVLHLSVKTISLVASIPYLGLWISSIVAGEIIDHGIKKRDWSVKWCRKIATYIGFVIPNTFFCLMVHSECNKTLAILCYAISVIFKGPHFAGLRVNQMDITVNFNGIVMSIVNSAGCVAGFCTPLLVSYLAPHNTLFEWKIVAWTIFLISFLFTTCYMFMARTKRAEWDVPPNELDEFHRKAEERKAEKAAHKEEKAKHLAELKEEKKKGN